MICAGDSEQSQKPTKPACVITCAEEVTCEWGLALHSRSNTIDVEQLEREGAAWLSSPLPRRATTTSTALRPLEACRVAHRLVDGDPVLPPARRRHARPPPEASLRRRRRRRRRPIRTSVVRAQVAHHDKEERHAAVTLSARLRRAVARVGVRRQICGGDIGTQLPADVRSASTQQPSGVVRSRSPAAASWPRASPPPRRPG